ncbi:MAG TPA: hypothetical protein VGM53_11095 [Streptosporangiaceae bacterium]|jgi:hypothetical protein
MKDIWLSIRYEFRVRVEDRLYRWILGVGRKDLEALQAGLAEFRRYSEGHGGEAK